MAITFALDISSAGMWIWDSLPAILGFLWVIPSHLIKYTCYHLDLIDLDPEQAGGDRWAEGGIQWHSRKKQACLSPKSTGVKSFALNYKWPGLRSQLRYLLCHSWQVTQPFCTPISSFIKWGLLKLISRVVLGIKWGKGCKHLDCTWHTVRPQ